MYNFLHNCLVFVLPQDDVFSTDDGLDAEDNDDVIEPVENKLQLPEGENSITEDPDYDDVLIPEDLIIGNWHNTGTAVLLLSGPRYCSDSRCTVMDNTCTTAMLCT